MSVYEFIPRPGAPYDSSPDLVKRHEHDIVNFYIGTARGNEMWDLSWVYAGQPMVERGPDRSFDKDMIFPASQIVTHDDKHWIYYNGYQERHGVANRGKHGIGLATLELDRFIGWEAKGDQEGMIVTQPFTLAGTRLEVNVNAQKGRLRVDVLDAAGNPIPGYSGGESMAAGAVDALRLEPRWKNSRSLAPLQGEVIRLRFRLADATLYAFKVNK